MIEEDQQHRPTWQNQILSFQKTLKSAAQSFISHYHLNSQISSSIFNNLKNIWLTYLLKWKQLNIPINSIFTTQTQDVFQQQTDSNLLNLQKVEQECQYQNQSEKKRRRSTLVDFEYEEQDLKQLLIKDQSRLKTNKSKIQIEIKQLIDSINNQTNTFFNKLFKIVDFGEQIFESIARQYVIKLYLLDTRRDQTFKGKNTYLKFKKVNLKISWLKNMVKNRHQINFGTMTSKMLIIYIFVFDMLYYKLKIRRSEKYDLKDLISRYVNTKRFHNRIIDSILLKFKLINQFDNIFLNKTQKTKDLPPNLNFSLIYSFIHLSLLKSQQVFYISQILQYTKINSSLYFQSKYSKTNYFPSFEFIRSQSTQLIKSLKLQFKESNRHLWIHKLSQQTNLTPFIQPITLLTKTLITTPEFIINQDIQCLACIIIFIKLHLNIDQQSNLALIPFPKIISSLNISYNNTCKQIQQFYESFLKIQPTIEQTKMSIQNILKYLQQNNKKLIKKQKFERLEDLKYLKSQNVKQIKKIDIKIIQKGLQNSIQRYQQIFQNVSLLPKYQQKQYTLTQKLIELEQHYQFKEYLLNQIPKNIYQTSFTSISKQDIILPSNNYQVIKDYRSNYQPLCKYQFMELLGRLAERRCTIEDIYKKVEELEQHLLIFEND